VSKNTQVGIRIPNDLYARLERERLQALERGEKLTMTEVIVKYLYRGLETVEETVVDTRVDALTPTLDRLTDVLAKLEAKL
jgi:hypothetical protein